MTFGYDSNGRPTTTTRADSSWNDVTIIAYDSYGRPLTKTLDNTTKEHYEYDSLSRLNKVMVKNSTGTTTLRSQNWVYDGVGNMTSRTIEGVTTTYSYDNIHQLITESRTGSLLEYTYDANGNRLSKTLNSGTPVTYSYSDDDRLLNNQHGTITYDAAGRPTAYPISSTVTRYFTWDYDDRLLGYSNTSGGAYVEAHKYNGAGARVEFSSGGTTRKDLRTGIGVTAPVVSSSVGGSTTVSYLPGTAEKRGSTKSYQHSGLKNVDAQSNASAAISATREYDAFGGVIAPTGTFNGPFGHAGNFGYQSEGSGLQLLGHRWYDPEVGRFLTRDPIQDGKNWFAYCENNPLGRVDPAGLRWYYDSRSGDLYWDDPSTKEFDPRLIASGGFAGKRGRYRNNPDYDHLQGKGPLPVGDYKLGKRRSTKSNGRPLDNIVLHPDPENNMYGRSHFLIHGGSASGDPSEGCIIFPKPVRDKVAGSKDRDLTVFDGKGVGIGLEDPVVQQWTQRPIRF